MPAARDLGLQPISAVGIGGDLDTGSSDEVFALMRRFNRESRTTFLIVTHEEAAHRGLGEPVTCERIDGFAEETGRRRVPAVKIELRLVLRERIDRELAAH